MKAKELYEVKMTSSVFNKFLNSAESTDFLFGFEAEMIFPADEEDMREPDYSQNEKIYGINFLEGWSEDADDSYAFARAIKDTENLWEKFSAKKEQEIRYEYADEYRSDRDYNWDETDYHSVIFKQMVRDGIDEDTANDHINDKTDEYEDYLRPFREEYDEETENYINSTDFINQYWDEEELWHEFVIEESIYDLKEFYETYGLEWPFHSIKSGEYVDHVADNIADKMRDELGFSVISSDYKVQRKQIDSWYIEPDSSISVSNHFDAEVPVEIVSPPMPLADGIAAMKEFFAWARSEDAYSNETTGFHISVSIPNMENVDYMKLVLFLGDQYILEQFGRELNSYTSSSYGWLKKQATEITPNLVKILFEKIKSGLTQSVTKYIADSGAGKYFAINTKQSYFELRAAGNEGYFDSANIQMLQDTVLRYAYAMYIASRPELYKKEYATKLTKLLSSKITMTMIDAFVGYATNKDKNALKYMVDLAREIRGLTQDPNYSSGFKEAMTYNFAAFEAMVEFFNKNKDTMEPNSIVSYKNVLKKQKDMVKRPIPNVEVARTNFADLIDDWLDEHLTARQRMTIIQLSNEIYDRDK